MKKILIADDLQMNIEVGKTAFARVDCQVYSAANGREALEVARGVRPDLIILDLYMPEMNGDECCRLMKEDPQLKGIPVIMATAGSRMGDEERCHAAGCDAFVEKPFISIDLMKKAARHLGIVVREYARVSIHTKALVSANHKFLRGYIHDLSDGGIFFETTSPFPVGTLTDLEFTLPDGDQVIQGRGEVRWIIDDPAKCGIGDVMGMGIRFSGLPQEAKELISRHAEKAEAAQQTLPGRSKRRSYISEEYAVLDAFVEFCGSQLPESTKRKIIE